MRDERKNYWILVVKKKSKLRLISVIKISNFNSKLYIFIFNLKEESKNDWIVMIKKKS